MRKLRTLGLFVALLGLVQTAFGADEDGVKPDSINLGIATALSGPIAESGNSIIAGYKAAFERFNSKGGIYGRKINLLINDDEFTPIKTIELTKKLINEDKVFALMGYNGTTPIKAVMQGNLLEGVLFLFPRTGDKFVQDFQKTIFNYKPSFEDETKTLISRALALDKPRIAIVYQADAFGDSMRVAAIESLKQLGRFKEEAGSDPPFVSYAQVPRPSGNPQVYKEAFESLQKGNPDVVILACSYANSEPIIRLAVENKKNWIFLSSSSTNTLADRVKDLDVELYFSQAVPNPYESKKGDLVSEYTEDLKRVNLESQFNYVSFESYINARIIAEAIKRAGKNLTRSKFIEVMEKEEFKFKGFSVNWSENNHSIRNNTYLTKADKGKFVSVPVAKADAGGKDAKKPKK